MSTELQAPTRQAIPLQRDPARGGAGSQPPAKKKILHLITGLEVGGAEMMLAKILPETVDQFDHSVCAIVGVGPVGDLLSAGGVSVHHLDLNHHFDVSILPKLKNLVHEIKPDVMITYLPHADLVGRLIGRLTGVPTIVCSIRVKLPESKYLPFFLLDGLTSGLVTRYHFNSQAIADLHRRYLRVSDRKITAIPNAIDSSLYELDIDIPAKKKELGLPTDKILIGCVARLRKQKGHQYLLRAFAQVVKQRPHTQLILIGDGEEKPRIVSLINHLNIGANVTLLGNRHDVPEILQILDIFALTTNFEGMSNGIMEAMSASRAILTTNIPENRELLHHGVTGMLVPKKDSFATAQALLQLVDNESLRRSLGHAAHQHVKQHYQTSHIAERYRQFYASL